MEFTKNEYELMITGLELHMEISIEALRMMTISELGLPATKRDHEQKRKIEENVFAVGVLIKKMQLACNPGAGVIDGLTPG